MHVIVCCSQCVSEVALPGLLAMDTRPRAQLMRHSAAPLYPWRLTRSRCLQRQHTGSDSLCNAGDGTGAWPGPEGIESSHLALGRSHSGTALAHLGRRRRRRSALEAELCGALLGVGLCGEDERVVVPDGKDADGDDERQAIECELRADVSA